MSPEEINNTIRRKQWVTIVMSLVVSLIAIFTTRALNLSDSEWSSIEDKIEKKADKEWVDDKIKAHEQTDAARYQGIKDMFEITNTQLGEIKQEIRDLRKGK